MDLAGQPRPSEVETQSGPPAPVLVELLPTSAAAAAAAGCEEEEPAFAFESSASTAAAEDDDDIIEGIWNPSWRFVVGVVAPDRLVVGRNP